MKLVSEKIVKSDAYYTTGKYVPAAVSSTVKLPNCTTFCMCTWHYVMDATKSYKLMRGRSAAGFGNAKDWYADYLFDKGSVPKIGAIAVWNGNYGHVAFVKSFKDLGGGFYNIDVYESYYKKFLFREHTYKVRVGISNPEEGLGKFTGFCYHPYLKEEPTPVPPTPKKEPEYKLGKVYTINDVVNVRFGPGTNYDKKRYTQLTKNAQVHATLSGCLKKGTQVTNQGTTKDSKGNIWMKIPSGYVIAYLDGVQIIK